MASSMTLGPDNPPVRLSNIHKINNPIRLQILKSLRFSCGSGKVTSSVTESAAIEQLSPLTGEAVPLYTEPSRLHGKRAIYIIE